MSFAVAIDLARKASRARIEGSIPIAQATRFMRQMNDAVRW